MNETISVLSILNIIIACLVGIALPIGMLIFGAAKLKADIRAFLAGGAAYILFVVIIEAAFQGFVFSTSFGDTILENLSYMAVYDGFVAALFEETGRLLVFCTILRPLMKRDVNALMYGAGHGGVEAMVVLGFSMINNLKWTYYINTGRMDVLTSGITKDALTAVENMIREFLDTPGYLYLLGSVERIFTVAVQLALSVLVWFAVRKKNVRYFVMAFLCHMLMTTGAEMLRMSELNPVLAQVCIGLLAAAVVFCAKWVWKKNAQSSISASDAEFSPQS